MLKKADIGPRCLHFQNCITEGDTFEELLHDLYDAVEGWLAVEADAHEPTEPGRTLEIAV